MVVKPTTLLSRAAMQALAASVLAQECSNHTNVERQERPFNQLRAKATVHVTNHSRLPASSQFFFAWTYNSLCLGMLYNFNISAALLLDN